MGSNLQSHPLANLFASFRSDATASRAASDDEGGQPLLPDGEARKPRPRGPSRLGRLASAASEGADLLPRVSFEELPSIGPASSLLAHTIILSKTIIGAGAAALPRAFDMLGLLCAGGFLLLVAYMTHFTNEALALGTIATGHMSFPEVVRVLCGRTGSLLLLLSLVLRCAGLVIIYVIISADVLAGHEGSTGLVCDLMGPGPPAWCASRPLMAGGVALLCMAPLVTPKRLASTAITSWLGMAAVLTWVGVTLYLVVAALLQGAAHALPLLPDADAFSGGSLEVTTQIVACLPVLATAYTCQMTIHHILRDMQPFTERRVTRMSAGAVGLCTAIFLSIALGSLTAFGPGIPADVLTQFNAARLEPLVGPALARAFYVAVRLGFLLSVITIAPSQMAPYRESLSRLLAGRELSGAPYYLLTYASLGLFFGVAMVSGSIWVPIQFVGATAGALIAFIFPALVALKAAPADGRPVAYWRWNAWALIVVGVVQAAAGVTATLFLQPSGGRNDGAALAAAIF